MDGARCPVFFYFFKIYVLTYTAYNAILISETRKKYFKGVKMNYKGLYIDDSMYGLITVQYCGDDVVFDSVEEAKQFIDEVTEE